MKPKLNHATVFFLLLAPVATFVLDCLGITRLIFHWRFVRSGKDGFDWVPGQVDWHLLPTVVAVIAVSIGFSFLEQKSQSFMRRRVIGLGFALLSAAFWGSLYSLGFLLYRASLSILLAIPPIGILVSVCIRQGWRRALSNQTSLLTLGLLIPAGYLGSMYVFKTDLPLVVNIGLLVSIYQFSLFSVC